MLSLFRDFLENAASLLSMGVWAVGIRKKSAKKWVALCCCWIRMMTRLPQVFFFSTECDLGMHGADEHGTCRRPKRE